MLIRTATPGDLDALTPHDRHIASRELALSLKLGRVYLAEDQGQLAGWLRWGLFWDNTPFMNLLYILDGYRGQGFGAALTRHWEAQMRQAGYQTALTSTQSDEYAQHFYQKLGYAPIGGFLLGDDPYELILAKQLQCP